MKRSNRIGLLMFALMIFTASLTTYGLTTYHTIPTFRGRVITTTIIPESNVSNMSAGVKVNPGFFGITVSNATGLHYPILKYVGALGKINGANWNAEEYQKNKYNWGYLDSALSRAEKAGIKLTAYTFFIPPSWTNCTKNGSGCGRGDAGNINISDYENFVSNVVVRYKGKIQYYELWNEPNCNCFWNGTTSQMLVLTSNAYRIIKAEDPNAIVIAPGMSAIAAQDNSTWLARYLKEGGSKFADAFAFHAYACTQCIKSSGIGCLDRVLDCAGVPLVHEIKNIRKQMTEEGVGNKPLYVTEGGIFPKDVHGFSNASQQAAFVSRWYTILASYNISFTVWYDWKNGVGLSTWPAAIVAYNQTYNWLNGATLTSPCSLHYNSRLWECPMTRPDGYNGIIVWSNSTNKKVRYTLPSGYTQYRDLGGNTHKANGSINVTFSPVIVESPIKVTTTTTSVSTSTIPITVTTTKSSTTTSTIPTSGG